MYKMKVQKKTERSIARPGLEKENPYWNEPWNHGKCEKSATVDYPKSLPSL